MALLAGIDIGGTNLRIGVVQGRQVVAEQRMQADFSQLCKQLEPEQAWQQIVDSIASLIRQMLEQYPQIDAIGIGFPGFVDPYTGFVAQSPNLPGLHNVDLAGDVAEAVGRSVIVDNDALAAAYGEYQLMPLPVAGLIYLGLGTGVGGGLVYAQQLLAGEHGVSMEIGHLIIVPDGRLCGCGNRGCMEQYASASGVAISYAEATGQQLDAHSIALRAASGDVHAVAAYAQAGAALAQALAHIVKVVDVAHIVIGGGMSAAWPLMRASFEQRLDADLIPVLRGKLQIRLSSAGDQAGIIGAAFLAGARSGN
ncbi:ROK family protein [Methylobacillus flagellatus]|uniref:ROK family protein n=1 Tax=Methylobacillus flagellatus TaxID=405 RepID=UPI0010F7F464|nr:ROK family protein [Methylobacillus flagellatus]